MEEIWKPVKNFEDRYCVSNIGRVYSIKRETIMKLSMLNGYWRVVLYDGNKTKGYYVHRIVAETFIPNPQNKPLINHIDENRANNIVSNLEWATFSENVNHGSRNSRVSNVLLQRGISRPVICVETGVVYTSGKQAKRETGIDDGSINHACSGRCKTAGGFHWQFCE